LNKISEVTGVYFSIFYSNILKLTICACDFENGDETYRRKYLWMQKEVSTRVPRLASTFRFCKTSVLDLTVIGKLMNEGSFADSTTDSVGSRKRRAPGDSEMEERSTTCVATQPVPTAGNRSTIVTHVASKRMREI
jgi:hypothetical protein